MTYAEGKESAQAKHTGEDNLDESIPRIIDAYAVFVTACVVLAVVHHCDVKRLLAFPASLCGDHLESLSHVLNVILDDVRTSFYFIRASYS